MKNLNAIGLDSKKSKQLADKLNELLANYSIFYQNTRGTTGILKEKSFLNFT
jgi:starvation-inducible DNA-binding protein